MASGRGVYNPQEDSIERGEKQYPLSTVKMDSEDKNVAAIKVFISARASEGLNDMAMYSYEAYKDYECVFPFSCDELVNAFIKGCIIIDLEGNIFKPCTMIDSKNSEPSTQQQDMVGDLHTVRIAFISGSFNQKAENTQSVNLEENVSTQSETLVYSVPTLSMCHAQEFIDEDE